MHTLASDARRSILVRFDPGEDLLASLQAAVRQEQIRNAAIVSGVGSLDRYRVHVVETVNMPPGNIFFSDEGPFDILAMTGLVVDGQVHAHVTFSNPSRAQGGHLESGCRVLTFAAAVLVEFPDVSLTGWDVRGKLATAGDSRDE